ncbi:MAG: alpha/beta hydrolase [Acidimicrobiaceae bacterium]|nr:alpha/beta hydrolase [Acidimicrobiaceae bacterium]
MRRQVLALPGLLCDGLVWETQVTALSGIADVTVADLSGGDDLTGMAEVALASVDGRLDVFGHSMGGRVAFEIWRQAPERVASIVVLDTGTHPVGPAEPASRKRMLDLAANEGMEALADAWLPQMVHPDRRSDAAFMRPLREMVLRATPEQHVRQIEALLRRREATSLLGTITVPTLVVVGRHDEWSPVDQHERIAASIPGARLVVIEDAGHMVTLEQPAAVSTLLVDWLSKLPDC